jgi:hypothetical protein
MARAIHRNNVKRFTLRADDNVTNNEGSATDTSANAQVNTQQSTPSAEPDQQLEDSTAIAREQPIDGQSSNMIQHTVKRKGEALSAPTEKRIRGTTTAAQDNEIDLQNYSIEYIFDYKRSGTNYKYLIHWEDPKYIDEWVPARNIQEQECVRQFWKIISKYVSKNEVPKRYREIWESSKSRIAQENARKGKTAQPLQVENEAKTQTDMHKIQSDSINKGHNANI